MEQMQIKRKWGGSVNSVHLNKYWDKSRSTSYKVIKRRTHNGDRNIRALQAPNKVTDIYKTKMFGILETRCQIWMFTSLNLIRLIRRAISQEIEVLNYMTYKIGYIFMYMYFNITFVYIHPWSSKQNSNSLEMCTPHLKHLVTSHTGSQSKPQ